MFLYKKIIIFLNPIKFQQLQPNHLESFKHFKMRLNWDCLKYECILLNISKCPLPSQQRLNAKLIQGCGTK